MSKVTDFDLKTLALANRQSAQALANLKQGQTQVQTAATRNLVAACGGGLGIGVGYGLHLLQNWSFALLSFVGCVVGIGLGALLAYLYKRNHFETRMEQNKIAMQEILARIRNLPKNAPSEVREELWQIYRSLNLQLPGQKLSITDGLPAELPAAASNANPSHAANAQTASANLPQESDLPVVGKVLGQVQARANQPANANKPPLTPAQKEAANAALKRALEQVENDALNMAFDAAQQQTTLASRLQTSKPMEWKQEKRPLTEQERNQAQDRSQERFHSRNQSLADWPEEEGETVFASNGEVFQANQKQVRSVVFPRMSTAH